MIYSVQRLYSFFDRLKSGAKTEIIVDSSEPDPSAYPDGSIWIQFTHEVSGV